jgi:hypothetical protein
VAVEHLERGEATPAGAAPKRAATVHTACPVVLADGLGDHLARWRRQQGQWEKEEEEAGFVLSAVPA